MLVFKKSLVSTAIADCRSKLDVTAVGQKCSLAAVCRLARQHAETYMIWISKRSTRPLPSQATDSYTRQELALSFVFLHIQDQQLARSIKL